MKTNKKTMKTIVFSLVLAAMTLMVNNLNAQDGGGVFGRGVASDAEQQRGMFGSGLQSGYTLSNQQFGTNENGGYALHNQTFGQTNDAPLGSGWLILVAASAGYALKKRKNNK